MPRTDKDGGNNAQRRRRARGTQQRADWSGIDSGLLQQAISTIAEQGGAIRFGYTRDGSAYAVGILGDGDPYTEYLRPSDDVVGYFERLIQDWEGDSPTPIAAKKA